MRGEAEEDFVQFVRSRSTALLRTAFLLTGDWASAEDLLQEALAKSYVAWRRIRLRDLPEPYVRRVLVNTFVSSRRRRWWKELPTASPPDDTVADAYEQADRRDMLLSALRALPARQRTVVVLRYWDDLSVEEVAALLRCPRGTVKSQSSRGLEKLKAVLEKDNVTGGQRD